MAGLALTDLDERISVLAQAIQARLRELDGLHAELREARGIRAVMLDRLEAEVMGWTRPQIANAVAEGRRRRRGKANG